jgi:putative sigma-54 modulation protein
MSMRLAITGRQVEITPGIRQLIEKRLAKLERILNDRALSAVITLAKEKYRHVAELAVHAKGDHLLTSVGHGTTWPLSIRQAVDKVERQAMTLKSRWTESKRQRRATSAAGAPAPARAPAGARAAPRVIRARSYPVKPMSVEDAAMRVEAGPDTFLVFRNMDTEAVSILYRRKDGSLGLIEPD